MRFRTFADHNAFCERLHAEIGKAGVDVEPLFCATSTKLDEYPRRFAMHFDCLTLEPLSTKHAVWLDFRKPLNLPPDRCSKLLYAEDREQPSTPADIPDDEPEEDVLEQRQEVPYREDDR